MNYQSSTAVVTVTVVGNGNSFLSVVPRHLSVLKDLINKGVDCSTILGYYVDSSGNISDTNNSAIGIIAYISTSEVDSRYSNSRIMVVSTSNVSDSDTPWSTSSGITSTLDTSVKQSTSLRNGFTLTRNLSSVTGATAAQEAWNYSVSLPYGASHWFLPSYQQWEDCRVIFVNVLKESTSLWYWSSTENGYNTSYAYMLNSLNDGDVNGYLDNKTNGNMARVRPVFVY